VCVLDVLSLPTSVFHLFGFDASFQYEAVLSQPSTTFALYNDFRTICWSVQGSGHPPFVFVTYCTPYTDIDGQI